MKTFITKTYQIKTEKLKGGHPVRFAVLADLHGLVFGNENQDLFHAIEKSGADAALVVGDMVVSGCVYGFGSYRIFVQTGKQNPCFLCSWKP